MKKLVILFLLFISFYSYAQKIESCKSSLLKKSEDSIQNSWSKYKFKIISKTSAIKPPSDFISVQFINNYAKSEDILDLIKIKADLIIKKENIQEDFIQYKIEDSIKKIEFSKTLAEIPKPLIIKTGHMNGVTAILYVSPSVFGGKYYLKISTDNGKKWNNYFTGLENKNNYFFKSNSKYPLWKDKKHIQIEADILRTIKPLTFPGGGPEYEIIKNNALITLNIDTIMKDSDSDGINDIEEIQELFTNPYSKDTDNDGIDDLHDTNPKYRSVNNDFTKLMQGILYSDYPLLENPNPRVEEFIINLDTFDEDIRKQREALNSYSSNKEKKFVDSLNFRVMVTDDENLRSIKPFDEKIIFLTSKEYSQYRKLNLTKNYTSYYSKLFKCEEVENTYILKVDDISKGESYLIEKIPEGWKVKVIDRWMT